ncbi:Interferon- developmental regulator 1 [Homalodisca vitripennis]|nr:Interferon- developmental regulator 1 [Homalodisca vitripennis]
MHLSLKGFSRTRRHHEASSLQLQQFNKPRKQPVFWSRLCTIRAPLVEEVSSPLTNHPLRWVRLVTEILVWPGGGLSVGRLRADVMGTSDEDSINDNASVISMASETTVMDEAVAGDEVDEQSQEDLFEEKLCEAIDGITQKSAQGRTTSLDAVSQALTRKYVPDFLIDRRLTVCDGIERCLKKGRGAEQASAAQLAALLCIQLGVGDLTDQVCHDLKPLLTFTILDNSASPLARAKCCWTLAMLGFLDSTDVLADTHRTLLSVFSGSYSKGDGTTPSVPVELATLHAAALSAWSLLLTIIDIHAFTDPGKFSSVGFRQCETKEMTHGVASRPTQPIPVGHCLVTCCTTVHYACVRSIALCYKV